MSEQEEIEKMDELVAALPPPDPAETASISGTIIRVAVICIVVALIYKIQWPLIFP